MKIQGVIIAMLKIKLFAILFLLTACACKNVIKDVAPSPVSLDQARALIKVNGVTESGINGAIDSNSSVFVRVYGAGSVSLRGLGDCGYITSRATSKLGWVGFALQNLPNKEFCLYTIQSRVDMFDSPSVGHVLVRRFLDPNVKPLTTVVNNVSRKGVNWVQLRADSALHIASTSYVPYLVGGINENKDITVVLNYNSGKLNITGCGTSQVIEYTNAPTYNLTVDELYRDLGGVKQSCIFNITANHASALKESASILVKVYNQNGSFIDAPNAEMGHDACFEFMDHYVVGIRVNNKWTYKSRLCVDKAATYEVEGVTSNQRIFYGIHDGADWAEMK
jgi:hypothetical protein